MYLRIYVKESGSRGEVRGKNTMKFFLGFSKEMLFFLDDIPSQKCV